MQLSGGEQSFTCNECGRHVVVLCGRSEFELCAACIVHPGWHEDPQMRAAIMGRRLTTMQPGKPLPLKRKP